MIKELKRKLIRKLGGIVGADLPVKIQIDIHNHYVERTRDKIAFDTFKHAFDTYEDPRS